VVVPVALLEGRHLQNPSKRQQRRRKVCEVVSNRSFTLAYEHIVEGGWVLSQLPHISFGGK